MVSSSPLIDVVLADDHTLFRAGLRALIERMGAIHIVGEAADGFQALELTRRLRPHVLVADISMPGLNGLELARRVRAECPDTHTLILSMHAQQAYVTRALEIGATGFLVKDASSTELQHALHAVAAGHPFVGWGSTPPPPPPLPTAVPRDPTDPLTDRQRQVLTLIAAGHSTKMIAHALNLSIKTVEAHRSQLMTRLQIHDLAGLVRYAIRQGLVSPDS